MIEAKTIHLYYSEGERFTFDGVPKHKQNKRWNKDGTTYETNLNGNGNGITHSRLILIIEVNNKALEIRIDDYFKEIGWRLTEKRRRKLLETMPKTVLIKRYENDYDLTYYYVNEECLDAWIEQVDKKKK